MKRRLFAVILTLCLLMTMLPLSVLSSADIIIVAINDTVPFSISEAAMPFYSSDRLYLPYSVFNNSTLGVVPSYDSSNRTLTLSNQTHKLVFSLDDGVVKKPDGTEDQISAIVRFGIMFVPAEYCTTYFGISLSYLTSQGGYPVVRLKTGDEVYSDSLFIEKAENLIAYRLSQYIPSDGGPVTPPVIDPNTGHPPADDPTLPPDNPIDENPPVEENPGLPPSIIPQYVYAICGTSEVFLDRMDNTSFPACFLLTPEQLSESYDLVRHIVGSGYTLGIDLRGYEDAMDAYRKANDALDEACFFRTALVLCDETQRISLREEGLIAFSPVENAPEVGASLLLLDPGNAIGELFALSKKDVEITYLRETSMIPYPEEAPDNVQPDEI
ncbi:MAG: hypothetical protein E7449_01255 [Ruminococcaceae bacterium]|nr:hypothetical protein [Oscillospiraceae bacterium]